MLFENFLVEIAGIALPTCISYALTLHFPLKLIDSSVSKDQNNLYICLLPFCIYLLARVYFAFVFWISSKIPYVGKYLSYIFSLAGLVGPFFHSKPKQIILTIYQENFEQIINTLIDLSKPDFIKTWEFSQKLFFLILAIWVVLFAFELVLRIVLFLVRALISLIRKSFGAKESQSEPSKETTISSN